MVSRYEVFLSFKSEDMPLAQEVHRYLESRKLHVFCSGVSLEQMGRADFGEAIDAALESSQLLIVLATSAENLESKWVKYEWRTFHNEIISDRKPGGGVFVYAKNVHPDSLPLALRQSQIISHSEGSLEQLYTFITNALRNGPHGNQSKKIREHDPQVEENGESERPEVTDASKTAAERLIEIIFGGNVAKPPQDLNLAIVEGLAAVDQRLMELTSEPREVELLDVARTISLAIHHGAGIYNHSPAGHAGCAKIYLRTAAGLAAIGPNLGLAETEPPAKDVALALRWLNHIATTTPFVRDDQANKLAWELRFAFDAIPCIPQSDTAHNMLSRAMQHTKSSVHVASALRQVLDFCQERIAAQHVRAYFLRQTAIVLTWLIETQRPSLRGSKVIRQKLNETISASGRILRENHEVIEMELSQVLEAAVTTFEAASDSLPVGHTGWAGLANWFRRN